MSAPAPRDDTEALPAWDFVRSRLAIRVLCLGALAAVLVGALALRSESLESDGDSFVCEVAATWRAEYGEHPDLRLVRVDIHFPAVPDHYAHGTGLTSTPVAMDLGSDQVVLATAAHPAPTEVVDFQGIRNVSWPYTGEVTREFHYVALALVRRATAEPVSFGAAPTFESLAPEVRVDATMSAQALSEHGLEDCKAFPAWARETAGEGPYPAQIQRLASAALSKLRVAEKPRRGEDVCAGLREGTLNLHQAQVVVVMGAREIGAPAFGFATADAEQIYLVGTFVDGLGWITLDLDHPEQGFAKGGPALLVRAPLLIGFEASRHEFWSASAGVYQPDESGWGFHRVASTGWLGREDAKLEPGDATTAARTIALSAVCE